MRPSSRHLLLVFAAFLALSGALVAQGSRTSVSATFREDVYTTSPADRIRGDGLGAYPNPALGDDCVVAWVDKGGFFFLRSVRSNCTTTTPRAVVLDFTDAVTPVASCDVSDRYGNVLNVCGSQAVADVRIIANSLFKDAALTSGTSVTLPFSLQPDFSSTGFELEFEQAVGVTAVSANARALEAPSTAIAELYQYVKQGRKTVKTSVGRFRMPFQLTVTKP